MFRSLFYSIIDALLPPRRSEARVLALTRERLASICTERGLPYHHADVRALIWEVKYRKSARALALAGEHLSEELLALASEAIGTPLVVPVPMHTARRRERGYNQTELLCKAALRTLAVQKEPRRGLRSASARELSDFSAEKSCTPAGLLFVQPVSPIEYAPDALVRTRITPPQQTLSRAKRLTNVKNSMQAAAPQHIAGRVCIVVDDVSTTGATLEEAARALRKAGAREVHTLALAYS